MIVQLEAILKIPFSTPDTLVARELQKNPIFCRPSVLKLIGIVRHYDYDTLRKGHKYNTENHMLGLGTVGVCLDNLRSLVGLSGSGGPLGVKGSPENPLGYYDAIILSYYDTTQ